MLMLWTTLGMLCALAASQPRNMTGPARHTHREGHHIYKSLHREEHIRKSSHREEHHPLKSAEREGLNAPKSAPRAEGHPPPKSSSSEGHPPPKSSPRAGHPPQKSSSESLHQTRHYAVLRPCDQGFGVALADCKRKITLLVHIDNKGKTGSLEKYALVHSVFDAENHEHLMLYNPVVIRIHQQVSLAFPFSHLYSVNSHPYEVFLMKDNTEGYTGCHSRSLASLCGTHSPRDFTYHGPRGFCCRCDNSSVHQPYHVRGGQDCSAQRVPFALYNVPQDELHSSTHCLKFSPLWYSVNSLRTPQLHHAVEVEVFVEQSLPKSSRSWRRLHGKHPFNVGTQHSLAMSHNKQVGVKYVELSVSPQDIPFNYLEKLLLIPEPTLNQSNSKNNNTIQNGPRGPSEYLLVDKDTVNSTGAECDKIGVSYPAFVSQGKRCNKPPQSCLSNQPLELWLHDEVQKMRKMKGKYWLSNYGPLVSPPILHNKDNGINLMLFEYEATHESYIQLSINADSIILLRKGMHGVILEAFIESEILQTEFRIHVMNTGLVSSAFMVQLTGCIGAQLHSKLHSKEIGPQQSGKFILVFPVSQGHKILTNASCTVQLFNHKKEQIANRQLFFKPHHRCFCLAYCHCKCAIDGDLGCVRLSQEEYHRAGFRGPVPNPDSPTGFSHQFTLLHLALVALFSLLFLGLCKATIGAVMSPTVGRCGLCLFVKNHLHSYYEAELHSYDVVHNLQGKPVHPLNGQRVREMSVCREILLNSLFFIYLPFIVLHYLILQCLPYHGDYALIKPLDKKQERNGAIILPTKKLSELLNDDNIYEEAVPTAGKMPTSSDEDIGGDDEPIEGALGKIIMEEYRERKRRLTRGVRSESAITESQAEEPPRKPGTSSGTRSSLTSLDIKEHLKSFTMPGKDVFYNFTKPDAHLRNSGSEFSLCGILSKAGSKYRFSLDSNQTQVFEMREGRRSSLTTLLPLRARSLAKLLSAKQAMENVTEMPLYPCLNKVL